MYIAKLTAAFKKTWINIQIKPNYKFKIIQTPINIQFYFSKVILKLTKNVLDNWKRNEISYLHILKIKKRNIQKIIPIFLWILVLFLGIVTLIETRKFFTVSNFVFLLEMEKHIQIFVYYGGVEIL